MNYKICLIITLLVLAFAFILLGNKDMEIKKRIEWMGTLSQDMTMLEKENSELKKENRAYDLAIKEIGYKRYPNTEECMFNFWKNAMRAKGFRTETIVNATYDAFKEKMETEEGGILAWLVNMTCGDWG